MDILKDICIIELKDNRLLDDQTLSAVLQPNRPHSPVRSTQTTVEAVTSTNELPDKGSLSSTAFRSLQHMTFPFFPPHDWHLFLSFCNVLAGNEPVPETEGRSEQVVESSVTQDSQAADVFEVVDLRIRVSYAS